MALIKHAQSEALAGDAVVLDLGDLRREADRLRERARREAEAIVAEARAEREQLLAGAREEGFAQGHAEGVEAGRAEGRAAGAAEAKQEHAERLDHLASTLTGVLEHINDTYEAAEREARADVLELALAIGERVAKRAVELDRRAAARQVESALEIVLRTSDVVARIHPDDAASVEEALPDLARRLGRSARVCIEPDDSLTRGSAVLVTAKGEIDATVEGQIERLVESVRPADGETGEAG
jgi:flagellar biosynthesis/type III secretory pathway protein FliH